MYRYVGRRVERVGRGRNVSLHPVWAPPHQLIVSPCAAPSQSSADLPLRLALPLLALVPVCLSSTSLRSASWRDRLVSVLSSDGQAPIIVATTAALVTSNPLIPSYDLHDDNVCKPNEARASARGSPRLALWVGTSILSRGVASSSHLDGSCVTSAAQRSTRASRVLGTMHLYNEEGGTLGRV